jgi:hypothetical protein
MYLSSAIANTLGDISAIAKINTANKTSPEFDRLIGRLKDVRVAVAELMLFCTPEQQTQLGNYLGGLAPLIPYCVPNAAALDPVSAIPLEKAAVQHEAAVETLIRGMVSEMQSMT